MFSLFNFSSIFPGGQLHGCSPKKELGVRLKQDLDKDLLTIYAYIHVHSYTSKKFCCTEIILHFVSVSKQLLQWTNFCTNFSPKSGGEEWGTCPPLSKKVGDAVPPRLRPTTPWSADPICPYVRTPMLAAECMCESASWRRGGVRRMNEVNARRARLVPGWVTVFRRVYHLGVQQSN